MTISATSGLVSNIDYQSLITQLVSVKQIPLNTLNKEKSNLNNLSSSYSTLSSRVDALKTAADALRATNAFNVFKTSSTDETIVSASASENASPGSYQITVNNTAKSHKIASSGVATATTAIAAGAGSFSFQVGSGAVQTVAIDATTTLSSLRDSINNLKAGVTATLVNTGSGATPYELVLTSNSTGTANAINITQNDTTVTFPTTLQAAQDASFSLDGISFTRSSNTVTDAVSGLTLNLNGADAAKTVTVSVNRDTASIQDKMKAMVDAYNNVKNYISANNRYDEATKIKGVFFGDATVRSILDDLRRTMTQTVSGMPDTMNRFGSVGLTIDSSGVMSLDTAKASDALNNKFNDVVNLFTDTSATKTTKGITGLVYDMANSITDSIDGRIKLRLDGIKKNLSFLDTSIKNSEDSISVYETQVRAQFTALETMLATLRNQGNYLSSIGK